MNFGLPELLIILVIVLILFGSTRLPKLSRSIGESMKELREGFGSNDQTSSDKKNPKANKTTAKTSKESGKDQLSTVGSSESEPEKSFYKGRDVDKT